jgi:hypothetical protein
MAAAVITADTTVTAVREAMAAAGMAITACRIR